MRKTLEKETIIMILYACIASIMLCVFMCFIDKEEPEIKTTPKDIIIKVNAEEPNNDSYENYEEIIVENNNSIKAGVEKIFTETPVIDDNLIIDGNEKKDIMEFTQEEATALLNIAQAEAGNQGTDGMFLVMSVILNRKMSNNFPNTIKEIIEQDGQFETVSRGLYGTYEISPECHEALAKIEMGMIAPRIIGFQTKDSTSLNEYFTESYVFGDHRFYEEK